MKEKLVIQRLLSYVFIAIFLGGIDSPSAFADKKPSNEELCYMPAAELIKLFKNQTISPVDLLNAQIDRIKTFDSHVNAIAERHYEEALAQAKESEARYKKGNPRPLEGLTCAIKDDLDVAGWRNVRGSLTLKDDPKATHDSPLITKLREAGLVMHVQTTVPEFYCNLVTWNKLTGVCKNPWNPAYTPGGSSGGAVAGLVLGFTTFAMGSDMGGSIRFPAAMTGLYGFKPPYGRVATSLAQYESAGPLARTFDDMNIFQNNLAGPSPKMPSSLKPKLDYPETYGDIKGWRIAYDPMENWGIPIDKTVRDSMNDAVKKLRALGAEVVQVDLGLRATDFDTYALGLLSSSLGPSIFAQTQKNPTLVTSYIAGLAMKYSQRIGPKHLLNAEQWMMKHNDEVQDKVFMKGFKAIIMPTMCTPYVAADLGMSENSKHLIINGKPYPTTSWAYSFTWPWNLLGQYPVVNVPVGITKERIPLGMQIISNTFDDLAAFQIASQWAKGVPNVYADKNFIAFKHLKVGEG